MSLEFSWHVRHVAFSKSLRPTLVGAFCFCRACICASKQIKNHGRIWNCVVFIDTGPPIFFLLTVGTFSVFKNARCSSLGSCGRFWHCFYFASGLLGTLSWTTFASERLQYFFISWFIESSFCLGLFLQYFVQYPPWSNQLNHGLVLWSLIQWLLVFILPLSSKGSWPVATSFNGPIRGGRKKDSFQNLSRRIMHSASIELSLYFLWRSCAFGRGGEWRFVALYVCLWWSSSILMFALLFPFQTFTHKPLLWNDTVMRWRRCNYNKRFSSCHYL